MPTIHRAHGFRFMIYLNDHIPAHVHALGTGGEIKVVLGSGATLPQIAWVRGDLGPRDIRLALEEVHKRADHMHAEWRRIHRGDM